jgi:hypothetical protein
MTAVRIGGALAWFWFSAVPWSEARARTAAVLAAADAQGIPDVPARGRHRPALAEPALSISGLAFFAGEPDAMLALSARAAACGNGVDRGAPPPIPRWTAPSVTRRGRGRATMRGNGRPRARQLGAFDTALGEMAPRSRPRWPPRAATPGGTPSCCSGAG